MNKQVLTIALVLLIGYAIGVKMPGLGNKFGL